jgi:pilus assembly protein CpaB
MRSKLVLVVIAVVLGGVAAFAAFSYLSTVQRQAEAGSVMTDVLVAKVDIPRGADANGLLSSGMVETTKMPLRYVPSGAVSSLRALTDMVLAVPVTKGEVITTARFQYPSEAGLAFGVPTGFVAVTVPVDDARGVAGLVKAGDRVAVLVTVGTKSGAGDRTRIVLSGAKVLAVGRNTGADATPQSTSSNSALAQQSNEGQAANTLTLAVSPLDAEKLVFAAEAGRVWMALLPTTESGAMPGPGQSASTVLK